MTGRDLTAAEHLDRVAARLRRRVASAWSYLRRTVVNLRQGWIDRAAAAGSPTIGSSLNGAIVSMLVNASRD